MGFMRDELRFAVGHRGAQGEELEKVGKEIRHAFYHKLHIIPIEFVELSMSSGIANLRPTAKLLGFQLVDCVSLVQVIY